MSKKQEGVTGGGILQILRWVITWLNRGVAGKWLQKNKGQIWNKIQTVTVKYHHHHKIHEIL